MFKFGSLRVRLRFLTLSPPRRGRARNRSYWVAPRPGRQPAERPPQPGPACAGAAAADLACFILLSVLLWSDLQMSLSLRLGPGLSAPAQRLASGETETRSRSLASCEPEGPGGSDSVTGPGL